MWISFTQEYCRTGKALRNAVNAVAQCDVITLMAVTC